MRIRTSLVCLILVGAVGSVALVGPSGIKQLASTASGTVDDGGTTRAQGWGHRHSPDEAKEMVSKRRKSASLHFKSSVESLFDSPDSKQKLESLDAAFNELLTNTQIERADKIEVLMDLLKSREDYQALYVLDNLAHLHPIERAGDLIKMFGDSKNLELRSHLLTTIRDALTVEWDSSETENPSFTEINSSEQIIFEFAQKLALSDEGRFSKYAILEMTPLLPQDSQDQILSALDSERMNSLSISSLEVGNLSFDLAVGNADEKSMDRFQMVLNDKGLEGDPDFLERVLSTLAQTAKDPRFKDLSRETLERAGDLSLSPALFLKAKQLEYSLNGVPEEDFLPELGRRLEGLRPIERAAVIIERSEALLGLQEEASKIEMTREFIAEAEQSFGASKDQFLLAGLQVSAALEDGPIKETFERKICEMMGKDVKSYRCRNY
jgi:hypothetical protein